MAQDMDRHDMAMRYVLGDLSEEEQTALESRYLFDEDEFEELEIAEDELIDRHVRGKLSVNHSERFEEMLRHSPRLRERVEFAKILSKRASSQSSPVSEPAIEPTPRSESSDETKPKLFSWEWFWGTTGLAPALRLTPAAVMALMLASVLLVGFFIKSQIDAQRFAQQQQQERERRLREENARKEAQAQANQSNQQQQNANAGLPQPNVNAGSPQQTPEPQPRSPQNPSFATFFLAPSTGTRSSGPSTKPLPIPRNLRSVQLNLDVENVDRQYPSYNASLADANSRPIAEKTDLKPIQHRGRKYIQLEVARDMLPDGQYSVHVEGVTATGQTDSFADYVFRVRAR